MRRPKDSRDAAAGDNKSPGTLIPLDDIVEARGRIKEFVIENTPLIRSRSLTRLAGSSCFLKLENLQVTSSFKIRGAANKLCQMKASSSGVSGGIVTASAGNHGQAVALMARRLGLKATIVVPTNTPEVKIVKIRQYHPRLVLHGSSYDEAELYAKELAKREGVGYLSAYNDPEVIAGHGTVALEVLSQAKKAGAMVVPVGGGGLIAGICSVAKRVDPGIEIVGVQSEASPAMYMSIKAGRQVNVEVKDTIAEGLAGNNEPGCVTFDIVRRHVDRMLLVSEDSIRRAIRLLWEEEGQVVEGAGAVPVAAFLEGKVGDVKGDCVAVISGGNIDFELFRDIVQGSPLPEPNH